MKAVVCLPMVLAILLGTMPTTAAPLNKWDFGKLAYGSEVAKKPSWALKWQCDQDGGCTFFDDQGVEYVVWENDVVIKRFDPKNRNRHTIPFGIRYSDTPKVIIRTVEAKAGLHMTCDTHKDNANIPAGELFCSASLPGSYDYAVLELNFTAIGRLSKIQIYTQYV